MDDLTTLACAARSGDPSSMVAFIRASRHEVWSLCAHVVDEASADDLTQETYLRAFRALPRFRQASSGRSWLLSIARRVCVEKVRRRIRRRKRDVLVREQNNERAAHSGAVERVEVREWLGRLSLDRRIAFVLTQILELSYADAARICHCPVGTIRSRVAGARTDLIEAPGRTGDVARLPRGHGVARWWSNVMPQEGRPM
jgi:RNA polymerase sigma-70 factor (ECF subfamily)